MADEFVIVKKEDLEALANDLRSKSGLTGKFVFPAGFTNAVQKISGSSPQLGEKMYSFGAISDVHINTSTSSAAENFELALSMYENLGVNMVCISGDLTDNGSAGEINRFNSICADHPNVSVHFCCGNHDKSVTDADWQAYFGRSRNYELIHNDDVFLFMSLDYDYSSSTSCYTEGLAWVREKLNRYKGSRIFLFMHFPPSGYSGLIEGQYYGFSSSAAQDDELITLLNTIKNVTVFTGHSHYTFDVQNTSNEVNVYRFNASDVNLIHVPACAYLRDKDWNNFYAAEGWLVDVYEKGFSLTGYNIQTSEVVEYTEYLFATNNTELATNAIIVDTADATLRDGESVIVNVYLAEASNATVNVSSNNNAITVSPSTLTFTESNYNVPQVVTITAPNSISENANYTVTYSADGMRNRTTSVTLTVTITEPVLAANSTWYRGTTPRSNITAINIVDSVDSVPTTYSESWDASEGENGTVTAFIDGTTLYIAGNGTGSIATTEDAGYTFSDSASADNFTSLTTISGLNLLDTSDATDMSEMFKSCTALTSLDLSGFDTSNVTDMTEMFIYCNALASLDVSGWNTENLKYTSNMFWDCETLTTLNLSSFVTPKLKNMNYMFYSCKGLTMLDISNFNMESAQELAHMFENCESLTSLNLSHFVTTNAVEMQGMFKDCASLTSLDVSNFVTNKVTDMHEMFDHCDNLTTLNISNFDTSAITTSKGLYRFARKSGITNLTVGANFVQDYNMHAAGSDGMFYTSSSTPLTVTGANSVLRTYDFATDNRTVTFA